VTKAGDRGDVPAVRQVQHFQRGDPLQPDDAHVRHQRARSLQFPQRTAACQRSHIVNACAEQGRAAPATVSPRVLATMRCPSHETSRRCCDADTIRNANREPHRTIDVQAAIDEGRRCSVDDTFECGDVPFGRQRDQSRALPQDGQVLCADVGHIQRLQRDQLLQASQILTPECAKLSSRKEVAGARFDIAFSCSHPLRSSLCSRARSGPSPAKLSFVT
jgi:hypothetical protein